MAPRRTTRPNPSPPFGALAFAALLACDAAPDIPIAIHPRAASPDRTPIPKRPLVAPTGPTRTVVKFLDALRVRPTTDGGLRSLAPELLHTLEPVRARHVLHFTPALAIDPARLDALVDRARTLSGRPQPDLAGLYVVTTSTGAPASLDAARELQALDAVEFVTLERLDEPRPFDIEPPTPALVPMQLHMMPGLGIDAVGAWALGYRGEGVRITDIEGNWHLEHEEWNEEAIALEPGQTPNPDDERDHGSAVVGLLAAQDNGYGTVGMVPECSLALYSDITVEEGLRRAAAILSAAADSEPGDIVLLEMQSTEPIVDQLGPAELEEPVWMATRVASDAGIVIVAAAGNGELDLDRPELAYYRDRGDSGAIVVGAGRPGTRERLDFSTYGARVDVQGWGADAFTAGYGTFAEYGGDANQRYRADFGGTSSASVFVASAAALLQQAVIEDRGEPLTAAQVRAVLRGTGLPQGGIGGSIGPLPQAPAAIAAGLAPHDAPPEITITSPGSTQTAEASLETAFEIDASPDTARVELSINGEVQPVYDDVPPFHFSAVDFPIGTWSVVAVGTNVWGIVGASAPVVLEVGVEPPVDSSTGESSSGPTIDGTTGSTGAPAGSSGSDGAGTPEGTDETGVAAESDDAAGCGCRGGRDGSGAMWLAAFVVALGRRRANARR